MPSKGKQSPLVNPEPNQQSSDLFRDTPEPELQTENDTNDSQTAYRMDDLLSNTDSSRNGSSKLDRGDSAQAVSSVNGTARIRKVDRPNESSPLNRQIQDGVPIEQEKQPETNDEPEREIELTSREPDSSQKKVLRKPRYTFKTFEDCPCAFCKPKTKKEKENPEGKTGKDGKVEEKQDQGIRKPDGSTQKPTPEPIVIPKTQTEVQLVNVSIYFIFIDTLYLTARYIPSLMRL